MRKRRWVAGVLLFCSLAASGCSMRAGIPNPQYDVDTYDELKDELKEKKEILYPDISRYEAEGLIFRIDHMPGNPEDKHGYRILWGVFANEEGPVSGTVLRDLFVKCTTLEYIAYETDETKGYWREHEEVEPNREVSGVPVQYYHNESMVNLSEEDLKRTAESFRFPKGTYECSKGYRFEYQGCEYEIYVIVRLLPEEQREKNIEEEVEKGEEELLEVVRSIILQGGEEE